MVPLAYVRSQYRQSIDRRITIDRTVLNFAKMRLSKLPTLLAACALLVAAGCAGESTRPPVTPCAGTRGPCEVVASVDVDRSTESGAGDRGQRG